MSMVVTRPHLVDDEAIRVPTSVVDTVVVTFDGQYVWSFSPARDAVRVHDTWQVSWPAALQRRLDGTASVRLADMQGTQVHFEGPVVFRGNRDPLAIRDPQGHPLAVDRAGHLTRVFSETDEDTRRQIVEGTARALADLRDQVGIDAHLSYGGLLGAIRSGHMIGHDSDTDLAYLSRHTHPADVVRESFRIEREMRALGWKVVRMSGADLKLFLPLSDGRRVHVDVFGGFHVGETFYLMGGRSGHLPRSAFTPASTVVLEGVPLAAPAEPETVLEFLYGPGWRVPDPAFKPVDPLPGVLRLNDWMRGFRTHVVDWNELYRDRRDELPRTGSSFADWARARVPAGAMVADLGCGNGRDTVYWHRQGHRVIGFDFAGTPVRQTRRRLRRAGGGPDARLLVLNDARTVLLAGAELSRAAEPPYLYARQLVGCLDADARANLWRLCSMSLRRGGALFLEYSTTGTGAPKSTVNGLVMRVGTKGLVREIEAAGGRVAHRESGPGEDFFGERDPAVARLEVRWDTGTPHDVLPTRSHPGGTMSTRTTTTEDGRDGRGFFRGLASLPERVRELRGAVQENRRLNRRVAELTDVVAELLVPLADRDEDKARELLASYRETTLSP